MFVIEDWMFELGLSNGLIIIFSYVYNCIKTNSWNPKAISSYTLSKIMGKNNHNNTSAALNKLCNKGLLIHAGNTSNNCCLYGLTPKVFEVSKDVPVVYRKTDVDYTEQILKIMKKFKAVLGVDVYPIEVIEQYAVPLLEAGQTVDDLCAVIECKAREWRDDIKMCQFIRPQTLFGNKYDQYLQQSKIMSADEDIDISFIERVYSRIGVNPPDDLAKWCAKTLREDSELNIVALGWAIHSMWLDMKEKEKLQDEWVQNKMGSTNVLTKLLPAYKKIGINCQDLGDVSNMRIRMRDF